MSKSLFKFLVLIVVVVVGLVIFLATLSSDGDDTPVALAFTSDKLLIKTSDFVNGKFYSRNANGSWVGGELSWVARNGDLVNYNVETNEKRTIIRSEQFLTRPWKTKFNPNATLVLVGFEPRRLFRSTILARYAVHDSSTGKLLTHLRVGSSDTFQAAVWVSNDTVVATHQNDLYAIQLLSTGASKVKRLTEDGSDTVINGVADWVYEEEIFTSGATTIYPAPDNGRHVVYFKFNDSNVEPYSYNLFGDYNGDNSYYDPYFQYPKFGTVRYPKSGSRNPDVSIHVFRLSDSFCWDHRHAESCAWDLNLHDLMGRLTGQNKEHLVSNLKWTNHSTFAMQILNRVQNQSWVVQCDVGVRNCQVLRSWEQNKGWIDVGQLVVYDGAVYTLISVGEPGEFEYNHVARLESARVSYVTRGSWSVDEIVGVYGNIMVIKAPKLKIQNVSVMLEDSTQSHYYALDLSDSLMKLTCFTCYSDCTYNSAKFNYNNGRLFMLNTCEKQSSVPHVDLLSVSDNLEPQLLTKMEENKNLESLLNSYELPEVEYFVYNYRIGNKNFKLSCRSIGRKGWKSMKKVGVVLDVYGGPNSQKVTRRFSPNDWSYALTSSNPVVYLTIDGVGSGRQSNTLAFQVYRNLGHNEIIDKIYGLKQFLNDHPNVDRSRTLIWGWSYGGYLSAMVMGQDIENVFKCGVSVAPVVNWFYYDTIYTERYMSTPDDNPEGYNTSNVLQYLDNFKHKKYLLVHGNADDNVHYQQSMVLARGLETNNVLFRMQSYPDENHSLGGVRPHVFSTLEDFVLNQCFKD